MPHPGNNWTHRKSRVCTIWTGVEFFLPLRDFTRNVLNFKNPKGYQFWLETVSKFVSSKMISIKIETSLNTNRISRHIYLSETTQTLLGRWFQLHATSIFSVSPDLPFHGSTNRDGILFFDQFILYITRYSNFTYFENQTF